MSAGALFARAALLPAGWASDVLLRWDDAGTLTEVSPGASMSATATATATATTVIPGLPNLHSHAFQRVFAGLTEHAGGQGDDSFWTWRSLMYRFASRLSPDTLRAIATWLYVEMLEAGYTSVCEFHYVHHQPDGQPYADDTALSRVLIEAARSTGIGLTLLPVLYQSGGFGGVAPSVGQRRFLRSNESMTALLEALAPLCADAQCRLGLALHSLRAVPPQALTDMLVAFDRIDAGAPIHIHVAEQRREVEDCLAWSGRRPVAWLLDHAPVDARWCLVHATHLDDDECRRAARSGAVAGVCPSTEANLGDGVFALERWRDHGGAWGLGSDSHVTVCAADELRLLEYSQRLLTGRRNVGARTGQADTASALLQASVAGGAQACGRAVAGLSVGQRADFAVLDDQAPALRGLPAGATALATQVFAQGGAGAPAAVSVGGVARVTAGRHPLHDAALAAFVQARREMLDLH